MRTRAKGQVGPVAEAVQGLPKRRKRSAAESPQKDYNGDDESSSVASQTPIKPAKRVRFSDLGPELMQSTGLTPFVRRATLSPAYAAPQRTASPRTSRRFSLPPSLPSASINPLPSIEEIQFTPLRQVLDQRLKRRLRRSHLSEELNDIHAEQRADSRARLELLRLRTQDSEREETIKQLMLDLELQRQLGIEVHADEEHELADLRRELESLKQQHHDGSSNDAPPSPWEEETFFSSPLRGGPAGGSMDSPLAAAKSGWKRGCFDASCQAALPDHDHTMQIQEFEDAVRRLTKESSDAKASLEMISSELCSLGFAVDAENRQDLLVALRESFRTARLSLEHLLPGETSGGLDEGSLLLDSMITHVKRLVEKRQEHEKIIGRQQQAESALRGQFNATLKKAADLEQRLAIVESHRTSLIRELNSKGEMVRESELEIAQKAAEIAECKQRISSLEADAQEQSTSVERLQAALGSYRDEVASLEVLITKVEKRNAQKETEMSHVRGELDMAVAEREAMSQTLAKLRQDIQDSAFELSALARPGLKENVTQRAQRKRDSGVVMSDADDAVLHH